MSIAALIRRMVELGAPAEAIAVAVEAIEAEQAKDAERRAKRAQQKASERARKATGERLSRDNVATVCDVSATSEGKESFPQTPFKETPQNNNPPSPPTGAQTPKGVRSSGAALPEDWQPHPNEDAYAAERGLSVEERALVAEELRDWAAANRNRPIGRKADWRATHRGFIRRYAAQKAREGPRQQSFGNRWDDVKRQLGET